MGFERTKQKDILMYHKPKKDECLWNGKYCKTCIHKKIIPIYRIGGELKGQELRCELIGIGNSKRYLIRDDHTCIKQSDK